MTTLPDHPPARPETVPAWYVRVPVGLVLAIAAAIWIGWATGNESLTLGFSGSPYMVPWTALSLAALAAAIALQRDRSSRAHGLIGCGLALVVGVLALMFLAEYATNRSFGLDEVWFSQPVRTVQPDWPGRPSPWTAWSLLPLSMAVALLRVDARRTESVWILCLFSALITPLVTGTGYLFGATSLVHSPDVTGQAAMTTASLLLLVTAAVAARPDRNPLAWILARPDRRALLRLLGTLAGLPLFVGLSRVALMAIGLREDSAWALGTVLGAVVIGLAVFVASQREQSLWIAKEQLSAERAQAETRYHILADNSVDVIVHYRDGEVVWISPSVVPAFGWSIEDWTGTDFLDRIYPDDLGLVLVKLQEIAEGQAVLVQIRLNTADGGFHWVEAHTKAYFDGAGNPSGVIAALRVIDDRIESEQRLDRLSRIDSLTGLSNRRETFQRLEAALECSRTPGTEIGVLFCDVDSFKAVNDTFGHGVGDAVLSTLADRIRECVRQGDTVGRTGGDEMLVLLPGLHRLDDAFQIAKKILSRAAEPIHQAGQTVHATLSIGVTLAIAGEPVSHTTARADAAMYQAKHQGGNTVSRI
ncbi:MAG: diguanylate cyclase [Mycobacterium sp.]|nr:diguanylate cyclase [Mycobacterium sp.]